VHAKILDCLAGRLGNGRMDRKTQIILRGEVDPLAQQAAVVTDGAARRRTGFGRARERPGAALAAQVLPVEKARGAGKQIGAYRHAKVAHAPLQRMLGNAIYRGLHTHSF
jgi:hypothetical protein